MVLQNSNLLVIDPVREVWIPSHLSVIEYFEDHLWNQSQANCLVGSVCLLVVHDTVLYNRETNWAVPEDDFISTDEEEDEAISTDEEEDEAISTDSEENETTSNDEEEELNDPLHELEFEHLSLYARHHWPIHAKKSSDANKKWRLRTLLETFLGNPSESSPVYRCWDRMAYGDEHEDAKPGTSALSYPMDTSDLTPTSIASFAYCGFGLAEILPDWHNSVWITNDDRNKEGRSLLELAVLSGSIPTCRHLIQHGAEVNAQTESSEGSALTAASLLGTFDIIALLVKEGADVNMQIEGNYGSALAAAACWGRKEIVKYLMKEGGAEVNMQLQYGGFGSALAAAAYEGEKEVVEYLVKEGGAEVNMQLKYGDYGSTLAAAVYMGRKDIVEYLVQEGGAQVNMELRYGEYENALAAAIAGRDQNDWAWKKTNYNDTIKFLEKEEQAEAKRQLESGA